MGELNSLQIERRRRAGWLAVVCLAAGAIGFAANGYESAWASIASRVGIVLAALWMCLPTTSRPAVWSAITPGRLALIIAAVALSYRISIRYFPFLVAAVALGWFLRPKKKHR